MIIYNGMVYGRKSKAVMYVVVFGGQIVADIIFFPLCLIVVFYA